MDSSKNHRNILESYPLDLWTIIASYIPGEQLGRLKFTGSANLWRILRVQQVVKSVNLGNDDILFKCWPSFLNELPSIEELVIDDSEDAWNLFWPNLSDLPRTVRRLTILNADERKTFDFFLKDGHGIRLDDYVPLLEHLKVEADWSENCPWIKMPNNLTSLSVLTWEASQKLPPTLLHLEAERIYYEKQFKLPSQLQSLSLRCSCDHTEKFLASLPRSILSVQIGVDDGEMFGLDQRSAKLLPPSITNLGRITFLDDPRLYANSEDILLLLPYLTELLAYRMHTQYWRYLPETLKKLTIENVQLADLPASQSARDDRNGRILRPSTFQTDLLPRSLTYLELAFQEPVFFDTDDYSDSCLFPPRLTYLGLERVQLSESATKQLPPSLRTLEITNFEYTVCQHLPRNLTTLWVKSAILSPQMVKFLPRSLTTLSFEQAYYEDLDYWYDPETGILATLEALRQKYSEKIDFSISHRKSGVRHSSNLNIDENGEPTSAHSLGSEQQPKHLNFWQGEACLPTGLKTLQIYDNFPEINDSFFNQRLIHLEVLDLKDCSNISDAAIPLLPRGLTRLNLKSATRVTGKSFRYLPRRITNLNLKASTEIFDSDIQHLPRGLKTLHLTSAIHLTNGCIEFLPKLLRKLKIQNNNKITPAIVDELPFRLTTDLTYQPFETALWKTNQGIVTAGHNLPFLTAFYWVVLALIAKITSYFAKKH